MVRPGVPAHTRVVMTGPDLGHAFARDARHQRRNLPRDDEGFVAWMKHKRIDPNALPTIHAGDLLLVRGCEAGWRVALETFEVEIIQSLGALQISSADDVQQHARLHLLMPLADGSLRLGRYRGSGSLRGWVRVVARRLETAPPRLQELQASEALAEDPEALLADRQALARFKEHFAGASATLTERERDLLYGHYLQQKNLAVVAEEHGVSRATANRWIVEACARMRRAFSGATAPQVCADELSLSRILAHRAPDKR